MLDASSVTIENAACLFFETTYLNLYINSSSNKRNYTEMVKMDTMNGNNKKHVHKLLTNEKPCNYNYNIL